MNKWYIVKVDTNNGVRIGVCQEVCGYVFSEESSEGLAIVKAEKLSSEIGIAIFNNEEDELV